MKPRLKRYPGHWFEWHCFGLNVVCVGHTQEEAYLSWLDTVQGRMA